MVTSEHHTWQQILDMYNSILPHPVKVKPVNLDEFIRVAGGEYQIRYDRMFNRVLNNSKILTTAGIAQQSLKMTHEGLADELHEFLVAPHFRRIDPAFQARADKATGEFIWPFVFGCKGAIHYLANRFVSPETKQSLKRMLHH